MNKHNVEMWEKVREVDDNEIRSFAASEKERLESLLCGFDITWANTETEYQLMLYSRASRTIVKEHPWPYGEGKIIGRIAIFENGCDTLEQVQRAGRAFYYLWRNELKKLNRDLGTPRYK